MSRSLLPMFSSRTSMVSVLTFKCLIHFELTFVYGVKIVALSSISLICMSVFMAIPYSFDYHSFVIVWNQGVCCFQICSSQDCCGFWRSSVVPDKFCCCSVTQSCLTLCSPMACFASRFVLLKIAVASGGLLWSLTNFAAVQSLSRVWLFAAPWPAACQASLSFPISWSLLKLMSTELVMPSNHLIFCHSLLLLPSIFPSIRVFSNELALHIR